MRKSAGLHRELRTSTGLLDFSSNDYLGLSRDSDIRAALVAELSAGCPLGATGSRLVSGETGATSAGRRLCFTSLSVQRRHCSSSSGFLANVGVLTALAALDAEFFCDELNHASLIDGLRSTGARKQIFRHNDMNHLDEVLAASSSRVKIIVTESVFSMDGDLAPLEDLLSIAHRREAGLVLDEAHATGVFGPRRLGRLDGVAGLEGVEMIQIHTGGKALGGQGAFVLSSAEFREFMINVARIVCVQHGTVPTFRAPTGICVAQNRRYAAWACFCGNGIS